MDPDAIVTQMGLIFSQMRFMRRALEDIERHTSRYTGISFAAAAAAGSRFGEPPLQNGALRVYVVNLDDLTAGSGLSGMFEGLLGGVGRFFGGIFGGLSGGVLGGLALPYNLAQMARIAEAADRILARLGTSTSKDDDGSKLAATLERLGGFVDKLTALFESTDKKPGGTSGLPTTEEGKVYLALLEAMSRLVDGLILLVPIATGALASLLTRLDALKLGIVDLMQFALRNVFLLRGVTLAVLFDTLAGAARFGADLLKIIGGAVVQILDSLFSIAGTILKMADHVFGFLSRGLKDGIDKLMGWLRTGLGNLLIFLGDTRIFRLLFLIVQMLPALLPPLYRILTISTSSPLGAELPEAERKELEKAATIGVGPRLGGFTGKAGKPAPFPDLAESLLPKTKKDAIEKELQETSKKVLDGAKAAFGKAQDAVAKTGETLRKAADDKEFMGKMEDRRKAIETQAGSFAEALAPAQKAAEEAKKRSDTGLDEIARAYEKWLLGGGMNVLLGSLTKHFEAASSGPAAARVLEGKPAVAVPTTVEIGPVIIDVSPAPGAAEPAGKEKEGKKGGPHAALDSDGWEHRLHELEERAWRPDPGARFA